MNCFKDEWRPGETAHFEYHCYRGHDSCDAELWYRDHQSVTILDIDECDAKHSLDDGIVTMDERSEYCTPMVYIVRFADGHVGSACEDELYIDPRFFDSSVGPPSPSSIAAARAKKQAATA